MNNTSRRFFLYGSINAMLAVILGAFATHALKDSLPGPLLATFHTGVQYHMYHALGLLLTGSLAQQFPASSWTRWAGWLMLTGILLFCGSLYLLALSGIRWLGIITPAGGLCFIAAWATMAVGVLRAEVSR